MKSTDSVIVSWDLSHGNDVGVPLVYKQVNGRVENINAYQGEEAYDLYRRLMVKKKNQRSSFVEV